MTEPLPAAAPPLGTEHAVSIPADLYQRVLAFKSVVETVIEEELPVETHVALLLDRALGMMLAELLPRDAEVLLQSLQGLAARYPVEVYGFVTESLAAGGAAIDREALRRRIGFHPPQAP